jgi:hypothetical protein
MKNSIWLIDPSGRFVFIELHLNASMHPIIGRIKIMMSIEISWWKFCSNKVSVSVGWCFVHVNITHTPCANLVHGILPQKRGIFEVKLYQRYVLVKWVKTLLLHNVSYISNQIEEFSGEELSCQKNKPGEDFSLLRGLLRQIIWSTPKDNFLPTINAKYFFEENSVEDYFFERNTDQEWAEKELSASKNPQTKNYPNENSSTKKNIPKKNIPTPRRTLWQIVFQ